MSSNPSTLDLISTFTCLTSKNNHEEAMRLLKKVATMVRPLMKAHGWKITTLAEFYTKGLLGMNTNRGWKIQLCLRYHNDENTFLPWEDILGTMLHELTHNIRGPHDQVFYKALDDLNDEYDKVVASGYTGEGFDAAGHRLGTKSGGFGHGGARLGGAGGAGPVTSGTKAAAVVAAEKRRQMNEMMLPAGGRRLGGSGTVGAGERSWRAGCDGCRATGKRSNLVRIITFLRKFAESESEPSVFVVFNIQSKNATNCVTY
ncbi:hypothetical protein BGZ96_009869 [Linnemannia gamsii]|uniref:WLM domain-containing protein n=1 Tax=Linnemannia gamsii TaxID=64522 RepID=A0ABQ7JVC3_9FUNG|nr:hypothetical protein BGZ96_009869 [Linnemannia gamsii]